MKTLAWSVAVLVVSSAVIILSERGCSVVPASDGPLETEERLKALIGATFEQKSPDAVDLWGTKLRIVEVQDNRWTTSAGPDKTFDTMDDVQYSSAVPR